MTTEGRPKQAQLCYSSRLQALGLEASDDSFHRTPRVHHPARRRGGGGGRKSPDLLINLRS